MRILYISSARAFGGGERHLVDLANALSTRGHDLYVALRPDSPLSTELTGVPKANLLELPLRNALDTKSAGQLASFVGKRKIEIVHAHLARDYPLAAYATRRNRDVQLIVTRHVLFPLNRLHKVTLSRVARIIAVSESVGRQLNLQKLVPPERVTVVHNGIDINRFETSITRFSSAQFRRRWDLPEESALVASVGALNPLKGYEDFLQAAAEVGKAFPAAYFIIAGVDISPEQTNRARLERMVRQLKLDTRVRFIGKMDDITPLYCALDLFVSASRTESFGLAIAEAMAGETAVVATATEGAREIIQEGKTGLLVDVGDVRALAESVAALLGDKEARERMGKSAREDVRVRFSLDRMVDATERIYYESLPAHRRLSASN